MDSYKIQYLSTDNCGVNNYLLPDGITCFPIQGSGGTILNETNITELVTETMPENKTITEVIKEIIKEITEKPATDWSDLTIFGVIIGIILIAFAFYDRRYYK
jgi:hypothetical protein